MKRNYIFMILAFLIYNEGFTQEYKKLTLEDIYHSSLFKINTVKELRWMNDGDFYTALVQNNQTGYSDVLKYSTKTAEVTDTLIHGENLIFDPEKEPLKISSYQFNKYESKILISSEVTKIYRRSSKAINYIFDLNTQELNLLTTGAKQSFAAFSPQGNQVAFVRGNNLFITNLAEDNLIAVTDDGKKNEILNGMADWVYEEELSLSKAFFWSPDSKKIAFLKFNEKEVPVYNLQKWNGLYPEDYTFKYPKSGERNAVVSVHVYDIDTKKTTVIPTGENRDSYIARLQWLPSSDILSIIKLNRLQNKLEIIHANAVDNSSENIFTDISDTYIDIDQVDDLTYMPDGKSFIISSERSGFKHLYHYDINGKLITQITDGEWDVIKFYGLNEQNKRLCFTSKAESPLELHIYSISLKGNMLKKMSVEPGTHAPNFSKDFKYYVDTYSSVDTPDITTLYSIEGKTIEVLVENSAYKETSEMYGFAETEFFTIPIPAGDSLNTYIMKPRDFNKNKKYPLLMFVYGGPGSQRVLNKRQSRLWHQYLVQQGYIIACVDNRGTGGRGRDFQHITYKQLGLYESEDQISTAKYLGGLPYIDATRIGIWGWSYGGYLSSLSLLLGNDLFKAAIAVAPVTNWRYYDTIYTERYLQKPQDNPSGYDDFSPQTHADKLKGSLLLIHGTGDDNVHFQNSVEFQNALIKANKQFDSFFYPDRNHGIYGGNTQLHLYTMMTNFILEKL